MAVRRSNSINLPGVLGGALAPLKPAYAIALGFALYPGHAAFFHDLAGETVGPPLNNKTTITFSVAPSSGDTLVVVMNGVTYTQAWDTDAATTMTALATQLQNATGIDTATKNAGNTEIVIVADFGKECVVSSVSNSDGTTTDIIKPESTLKFAGIVERERSEAINGELKFVAPKMVTLLTDGDSISAKIGGQNAATFNILSDVTVRVVEGNTAADEYRGQICVDLGPAAQTFAQVVSELSFEGAGTVGEYDFIQVTKGA